MSGKPIILCDLDGTLADVSHQLHHIDKHQKDWDAFFDNCGGDAPIVHMIRLLELINRDYVEIWITSGRSSRCREQTEEWLNRHVVPYDRLIMRNIGDCTDDGILKPSWLTDGTIPRNRVLLALDDRNRVVDGWRKAGVPCLQVAAGGF